MFQPGPHLRAAFCGCALLTAACAPRTAAPIVSAPATAPIVPAVASPDIAPRDVVADAMAASSDFFAVGQRELALGHLTSATRAFNEALAVLLRLPEGARADNRARIRFDRLVEQISALELAALVRGDGFTERPTEPASIDEILALSTLAPAEVTQLTADAVATAFERDDHDIPIPLNSRVLGYVELYRSRLKTSNRGGAEPRVSVFAHDPGRLSRGGDPAGSGVYPPGRERIQVRRTVKSQRARNVAVHACDRR